MRSTGEDTSGTQVRSIRECFAYLRKKEPDVVHFYFSPFTSLQILREWRCLTEIDTRIIVTYYNYRRLDLIKSFVRNKLLQKLANEVIVHSWRSESYFEQIFDKVWFLLPPVSDDFFGLAGKREPSHISYLGRISRDKGIDTILRLANEFQTGIIISGYTEKTQESQALDKALQIAHSREILEYSDFSPLNLMRFTKFLLLPYHTLERTVDIPLAVLEAMAAGVPMLVTNIGDLGRILPEACIVDDWNTRQVREKLSYMDENYQEISEVLSQKAKQLGFEIEKIGMDYVDILERGCVSRY